MTFFYTDESSRDINLAILHRLNPVKQYLKHYDNLLFLQFILNHQGSSRVEKHQALKETALCERKLRYWSRNAGFNQPSALRGIEELKSKWNTGKAKLA